MKNIRVKGYDIPETKKCFVSLQYIKGIGKTSSIKILKKNNIDINLIVSKLTHEQIAKIETELDNFIIGEQLTNLVKSKIEHKKRLMNYEGMRHKMGMPLKGRTKTNAKTRKKHLRKKNNE